MTNEEKINEWAKLNGIGDNDKVIYTTLLSGFTECLDRMEKETKEGTEESRTLISLCSFFFDAPPQSTFTLFFYFFSTGYVKGMEDWNSFLKATEKKTDKE